MNAFESIARISQSDMFLSERLTNRMSIPEFRIAFLKTTSGNNKADPLEVVNPGVRTFTRIRILAFEYA